MKTLKVVHESLEISEDGTLIFRVLYTKRLGQFWNGWTLNNGSYELCSECNKTFYILVLWFKAMKCKG